MMVKKMISTVMALLVLSFLLVGCQKAGTVQHTAEAANIVYTGSIQPNVGQAEAINAIKNTISMDYNKYQLRLVRDNLNYNGQGFYEFQISDGGSNFGPSLIVSRDNGAIYCYYQNHTIADVFQDSVFRTKC